MGAVRLAAIATALLFAAIAAYLAPLSPSVIELQMAATPAAFGAIVHTWPPEHLARFRNHLPADCLLLVAYSTLGVLLARRAALFAALAPALRRAATWMLPAAALFDAGENALHWWLTEVPRFGVPLPYALAAGAAAMKWLLLLAFVLLAVVALARRRD